MSPRGPSSRRSPASSRPRGPSSSRRPGDLTPARADLVTPTEARTPARANLAPSPVSQPIRYLGRLLADQEKVRISHGLRVGAGKRDRGESFPELDLSVSLLGKVEEQIEKELMLLWRDHPLYGWVSAIPRLGGLLPARLLAEVGDPAVRALGHFEQVGATDRRWVIDEYVPRSLAQLRQFCGVGRPGHTPKNATQAEVLAHGNRFARVLLWRIGQQFVYGTGGRVGAIAETRRCPYRDVYEERYAETDDRIDERTGKPWPPHRRDSDAQRIAEKRFLRDLWYEDALRRGLSTREA